MKEISASSAKKSKRASEKNVHGGKAISIVRLHDI